MRIVDLRAKLGIKTEKSGIVPSGREGVKERSRQTWTEVRSNVWPEETTTGSNIRELAMGQRN